MPTFGNNARQQQGNFRNTSPTIGAQGRSPSDDKGQRHSHLLALGHETDNLYPSLRGDDGALRFFRERNIKWWRDTNRTGDARGINGPTRNMASSQVACVNFLLPLTEIGGALAAVLRAIDGDVKSIVDIEDNGNASPVEFEWIGLDGPLEEGAAPTRGANTTSSVRSSVMLWKWWDTASPTKTMDPADRGRSSPSTCTMPRPLTT